MLVFCIKNYQIPPARVSTHQSRLRSTDSHAANTSALAKAAKAVMLHSGCGWFLSHPQSATTSPLLHFSGPPLVTITSWFRKNMKKYRAQIDTNWSLAKPAVFMDSFIQEMRKPADSPASSSGRLGFAVAHPKAPLMRVPHPCSSSAARTNTVALSYKHRNNQSERCDKKQMLHGTSLPIPVNLPFLWSTGACLPVVYFIIDMIFVVSRHLSLSNFAVIELFWTVPSITTSSSRTNLREKSSCKVNCHVVHLTHAAINPCLHQASIDHPFGNECQPERPPTIHTAMNSETPKPGINKWL